MTDLNPKETAELLLQSALETNALLRAIGNRLSELDYQLFNLQMQVVNISKGHEVEYEGTNTKEAEELISKIAHVFESEALVHFLTVRNRLLESIGRPNDDSPVPKDIFNIQE